MRFRRVSEWVVDALDDFVGDGSRVPALRFVVWGAGELCRRATKRPAVESVVCVAGVAVSSVSAGMT